MKIGFLLNLTFLLCFIVTQLLIWLLDGTLVHTFAELLDIKPLFFSTSSGHNTHHAGLKNLADQTVASIYHSNYDTGADYH